MSYVKWKGVRGDTCLGSLSRINDFIRVSKHYCKQTSQLHIKEKMKKKIMDQTHQNQRKNQLKMEKENLIDIVRVGYLSLKEKEEKNVPNKGREWFTQLLKNLK